MPLAFTTSRGNLSRLLETSTALPEQLSFNLASSSSSSTPVTPPFKWASRPYRRIHRRAPYASITGASVSFWGIGVHGESIRSTFNKIDKDRKGHITEADLQQFAEAHSLPRSYVRPFLDAVLQQQHQQQQQLSSSEDESEGEVGYAAFREFVVSREAGLREAFSQFDLDGDGHISAEDLHSSLARVSICSPRSRCVLRTSQDVVGQLLARIDMDGSRRLSFGEFRRFFMLLPQQGQLVEYWLSGPAALQCADMGGHFSILERNRHSGAPWGHLLAGAVAGAASRSATAPLETLRLAAMAGALPPGSSLLSAAQGMVAAGGPGALFRGNLVNVMRSAPARAVDFLAFDLFKSWLGSDTYAKTFAAAGLAGTLSWALLYPLEVVRSRMTLALGPVGHQHGGLRGCVAGIAAREGLGAFYRGLGPSLLAIAPEAAITYGLHDLLKRAYSKAHHREPGIGASLCCGVLAAWSGQMVAFPLETVSRRMQMAGPAQLAAAAAAGGSAGGAAAAGGSSAAAAAAAAGGGAGGSAAAAAAAPGMLEVLRSILKEGGPTALYRGLGASTLRLVPSAIISFGTYELMRKLLLELEAQQEVARCRAQQQQLATVLSSAQRCNQQIQQLQSAGVVSNVGCVTCDQDGNLQALPECSTSSSSSSSSIADSSGSSAGGAGCLQACSGGASGASIVAQLQQQEQQPSGIAGTPLPTSSSSSSNSVVAEPPCSACVVPPSACAAGIPLAAGSVQRSAPAMLACSIGPAVAAACAPVSR